jgi:hypothetical protein
MNRIEKVEQISSTANPPLLLAESTIESKEIQAFDHASKTTFSLQKGRNNSIFHDPVSSKGMTVHSVNHELSSKSFQHSKQVKKVPFGKSETELDKMDRVRVRYKVLSICYGILTLGSIPFVVLAVEWVSAAFIIVPLLGIFAMALAVVLGKRSKHWVTHLNEMERLQLSDAEMSNEEKPAGDPKRLRLWSIIGSIPVLFVGTVLLLSLFSLLIF